MGTAKLTVTSAPDPSRARQPRVASTQNSSAGTIRNSPTWRMVADAPRMKPATAMATGDGRGFQARMTRPATISASNATSGMIVCSIWSW